jgi:large subunit ribosomal protein L16
MLSPKRVKHRKVMRGRRRGKASRGNYVAFGDFGLMAEECGWITAQQIEAARIAITRHVKRGGQVWIRYFRTSPLPSRRRPAWGKVKAARRVGWRLSARPGPLRDGRGGPGSGQEAMRLASHKLPIPTKFVEREHQPAAGAKS